MPRMSSASPSISEENPCADERIQEEAALWFARLRGDEVADAERAAFARWLEADARHRHEFDILKQVWGASAGLRPQAIGKPRRRRAALRAAAGLAGIALACGWLGWAWLDGRMDMTTEPGQRQYLRLADGSELDMAPSTRLRIKIGASQRRLELVEGRIAVSVAADPQRPFEVTVGGGIIRDVGTRFEVSTGDGRTRVAVAEGAVEISVAAAGDAPRRLGPGETAEFDGRRISSVRPVDAEASMAWTKGQLVFDAAPLAEVVAALNAYRKTPIELADPALAGIRISGVFLADDENAALRALEEVAPVWFESMGPKVECRSARR